MDIKILMQPSSWSAVEHVQALWRQALRCRPIHVHYRLKRSFNRGLKQSIRQSPWSNRAKNWSASLQEFNCHLLFLTNLESGKATSESGQSGPESTSAPNLNARNTMSFESASSFESIVDFVNDGTITSQQPLVILERIMDVSDQLWTDLTWTAAMDQVHYCKTCLVWAQMT